MRFQAVLAVCAVLGACTSAPAPATTFAGQALVQQKCGSCHAVSRHDASRHPEAPALRHIGRSYPVDDLEESLVEGIMVGHSDMPEFKFSPEDAEAIIAYLQSIQS